MQFVLYSGQERDNDNLAVPRFRLIWGSRSLELDAGILLFGRGEDCALQTDDPLVSRQHARFIVSGQSVTIEDLESRNGVSLNGRKIDRRESVSPGDRIRIGNQDMTVLLGCDTVNWSEPPAPTRRFDGLGVVGELAEKALAMGRLEEAERLVEGPLSHMIQDATEGREVAPALLAKATELATRLAAATLKREWVNVLIRLYGHLERPWPADVIDQMYEIARRVSGVDRSALKEYVTQLNTAQLGPADKFLLRRIEGLERQFPNP